MADQSDPGLPTQAIWDIPFENLEFKERIGKGSFGSVFKGSYLGLDVAIKKIEKADDPEYLKYIDREVSMLQSLRHPFIVQFSGICVHTTGLYIITEFVSGGDVRQLLKQGNGVSWEKRISIAIDLAKVLVFLHAKKIIHRDLKSKNILLDEYQKIRLCDFGFARMNEQTKKSRHMTMCGTEGWVAPEILLGMSYDTSCDVFSYGVVLAELITGRKPGVDLWVRTPETCFDISPDELRQKALPGCPDKPTFEELLVQLKGIVIVPIVEMKSPDVTPSAPIQVPSQSTPTSLHPPQLSPTIAQSRRQLSSHRKSQELVTPSTTESTGSPLKTSKDASTIANSNWRVGALKPPGYYTLKRKTAPGNQIALTNHLTKMIERATSDYCYDTSYIQDLLLTYRCFATPIHLCELLTTRYTNNSPDGQPDVPTWKRVGRVIQLRVIIFFKRWIDHYPADFDDEEMADRLAEFDAVVTANNLASISLQSTLNTSTGVESEPRLVAELSKRRNELAATQPASPAAAYPTSIIPPPPAPTAEYLDVADVNPIELARQMSLASSTSFVKIEAREYLELCWEKFSDTPSPWVGSNLTGRAGANIHAFLEHHDDLARFVATEIVRQTNSARRLATVERFIETGERCLSQNDFASVFVIMEGLSHASVERLSETFRGLSAKALGTLEQLKTFVSKEGDYKRYRETLQDVQAPCVPHIRLLLDELFFIETSSPKLLNGGIVNFFHYRQLSRKILFTQQLLSTGVYLFRPINSIQKILSKPPSELFDDEVIRHYSLTCEPPIIESLSSMNHERTNNEVSRSLTMDSLSDSKYNKYFSKITSQHLLALRS
eukprot:gene18261-21853_t